MRRILFIALLLATGCAHQMRRVAVNGGDLEYQVSGRGEPVLLIHGSIFADSFKLMMREPALSGYRLINYHRRGFAGSSRAPKRFSISNQAADALALLDHLGIRRAHLVGHSYGGDIALQIATDRPDRVATLALFEPALFPPTPATQALGADIGAAMELHAKGNDRAAIEKFVNSVVAPGAASTVDAALGAGTFDQAVTDAPTFFDVEVPALGSWGFTIQNAGAITIPTLLLLGADSRAAFRESVEALRAAMSKSDEVVIANVPHTLEMSRPREVAEALAAFLQKHPM